MIQAHEKAPIVYQLEVSEWRAGEDQADRYCAAIERATGMAASIDEQDDGAVDLLTFFVYFTPHDVVGVANFEPVSGVLVLPPNFHTQKLEKP